MGPIAFVTHCCCNSVKPLNQRSKCFLQSTLRVSRCLTSTFKGLGTASSSSHRTIAVLYPSLILRDMTWNLLVAVVWTIERPSGRSSMLSINSMVPYSENPISSSVVHMPNIRVPSSYDFRIISRYRVSKM